MPASPFVRKDCARKMRRAVVPLLCWLLLAGFTVFFGNALVHKLSDGHTE